MPSSPEQQVQELQAEYQRRLAEIKDRSPEVESPQEEAEQVFIEHQALSETTEQMIKEQVPQFQASSHEPMHSVDTLSEEAQATVQQWVQIASQDPYKAVQEAEKSQDIALIDAFHGALTSDKYFADLVKRKLVVELAA